MKISISILDANNSFLQEEINSISSSNRIHLDIMDGEFVSNSNLKDIDTFKNITFPIETEVHLMTNNPEKFFKKFKELGVKTIYFHIENTGTEKAIELLNEIKNNLNIFSGIVVNANTDISVLTSNILNIADNILIMSVEAGYGGQEFMTESIEKIKKLRKIGFKGLIEVDGGINIKNAKLLKKAGADIIVVGSFVMKNSTNDRIKIIKKFQEL